MSYLLQTLPPEQRPRERLLNLGAGAMTTVELLAILLGSGTKKLPVMELSASLFSRFGSLSQLACASIEEISELHGMGTTKAIQLKAALSLAERLSDTETSRQKVLTPRQVYDGLKSVVAHESRELFIAVLLDSKMCWMGHHVISIGTLSKTLVHPREVYHPAVKRGAAGIIVAHNHPSGDAEPSIQDIEVTERLIKCGELMGIPLYDHIILGRESFVSLKERGECF